MRLRKVEFRSSAVGLTQSHLIPVFGDPPAVSRVIARTGVASMAPTPVGQGWRGAEGEHGDRGQDQQRQQRYDKTGHVDLPLQSAAARVLCREDSSDAGDGDGLDCQGNPHARGKASRRSQMPSCSQTSRRFCTSYGRGSTTTSRWRVRRSQRTRASGSPASFRKR
jgi:hypothetical protein